MARNAVCDREKVHCNLNGARFHEFACSDKKYRTTNHACEKPNKRKNLVRKSNNLRLRSLESQLRKRQCDLDNELMEQAEKKGS